MVDPMDKIINALTEQDQDLLDWLDRYAQETSRSRAGTIRFLLKQSRSEIEKKKGE